MSHRKYFIRYTSEYIFDAYKKWHRVCDRPGVDPFNTHYIIKFIYGGYDAMPGRKSKTNTNASTTNAKNTKTASWVRVPLDDTDIAYAIELAADTIKVSSRIASSIADGWGFSVKFDAVRKNYTCFIISPESENAPQQIGISAFAPDGISAVAACFCKWDKYAENPTLFGTTGNTVGIG